MSPNENLEDFLVKTKDSLGVEALEEAFLSTWVLGGEGGLDSVISKREFDLSFASDFFGMISEVESLRVSLESEIAWVGMTSKLAWT